MKLNMNTLKEKSIAELKEEAQKLRKSISQLYVENHSNPHKDTNLVYSKRKELARILTVVTQKQLETK